MGDLKNRIILATIKINLHFESFTIMMKIGMLLLIACSMVHAGPYDTCPLEDISYWPGTALECFQPVYSWQECGTICSMDVGNAVKSRDTCQYWTLNNSQMCCLFNNNDGIHVQEGEYSGDVNCFS